MRKRRVAVGVEVRLVEWTASEYYWQGRVESRLRPETVRLGRGDWKKATDSRDARMAGKRRAEKRSRE